MPQTTKTSADPALSILVPTYGRPDRIRTLLKRLEDQTAPSGTFEVVVVDDGSEPAISLDLESLPYPCTLLRQPNAGPAAARNKGLGSVRAPLALILNDDAVPAPDLVEAHLAAHDELGPGVAVLGTFDFTAESQESPFVRLLQGSDLLFAFTQLEHGKEYPWAFFWTCNISLSVEAIRRAGMFDAERFDIALCEDVELGLRLCDQGLRIVHRADCRAEHEHRLTPESYMERAFQLGRYQHRLGAKFNQPEAAFPSKLFAGNGEPVEGLRRGILELQQGAEAMVNAIDELEASFESKPIPEDMARDAHQAILDHSQFFRFAGLWFELTGEDLRGPRPAPTPSPAKVAAATIAPAELPRPTAAPAEEAPAVSVIFASFNALENTKRCVESLRQGANPRFPQEIIAVDNGSTDGSAEWLASQPDVQLVANPANHGAPRARNQAIALARGQWLAFLDNDVFVSRSWLPRALEHGSTDTSVGSIALMANRASKKQVLPYDGPADQGSIDAFADAHYSSHAGECADATLFTSLAVIVRRGVIDRIGGFDEAFSPWGFEDDDLALRIRLAGWRNVVASDTFVFHAEYGSLDKHERHAAWLQTNWDRFLAKWCPARRGAALFDYAGVTVPQPGQATEAQLVFPLPRVGAAPPTWEGKDESTGESKPNPTAPLPSDHDGALEAPEMTVLIGSRGNPASLRRCLDSFERQTARGRFEIVVVNGDDDEETRTMLEARPQAVPTRIVHPVGGGRSAGRNAGLALSRGRHVLFVDADLVAAEDLVQRHLAAHGEHGPQRAVRGTVEPPQGSLGSTLVRALENARLGTDQGPLDPAGPHDWTSFRSGNLSVALEDLRRVGMFDEDLTRGPSCDGDLGLRLERECGLEVVFVPGARTWNERPPSFDEVKRRSQIAAAALVELADKHPEALRHPRWRDRASATAEGNAALLAGSRHAQALVETEARELSRLDLGTLERTGSDGHALAATIEAHLRQDLVELHHLWWAEGENEGFRSLGATGMSDRIPGLVPARPDRVAYSAPRSSATSRATMP